LVELAALATSHGPAIIVGPGRLPAASLENYWSASKARLERWSRAIKQYTTHADEQPAGLAWPSMKAVLEEIFAAEILARVWSGVLVGYDRAHATGDAEPVAHSVLVGHAEVRHRAMNLLVRGPQVPTQDAVAVNRLRRRCERWTDLLLGYLLETAPVANLAFDARRATDFADDLRHQRGQPGGRYAWPLTLVSLRGAFGSGVGSDSPNEDANARVASSILACFPPEIFDGTGVPRSLWLLRLSSTTADAQGMIADLLGPDRAASRHSAGELPGLGSLDRRSL